MRRLAMLFVLAICTATAFGAHEGPFDYFRNSWNVVGLKDYLSGARVAPDNSILLAGKNVLRFRFGQDLTPLSRRQTKTALEGWLPVMRLSAWDGAVRYDFQFWATPLPTVKDWQRAFDWPTEGENFLVWATVNATNTGAQPAVAKLVAEQSGPEAGKPREFSWRLAAAASAQAVVRTPFAAVADPAVFDRADPKLWLQRTVDYWKKRVLGGARIVVPCQKATDALLAAHVCQLIASDHGELHGGEGFYDHFYVRDGGYQIMEIEEAGLADVAAKAIEPFLRVQRPNGQFESQAHELDGNGQAAWALWQYGKITGNRAWLERVYPAMRKAANWTIKARRQAPADFPYAGLLPTSLADGESLWDGKHHIVGYDLWNLRGLLCTADAARMLGKTAEADELLAEANAYRAAIDAAWKKTHLAYFPPSWEKAGTHWGNTETLWPTPLFSADDPRVAALVDEVRRHHGGGYVEGTIRWFDDGRQHPPPPAAIHPYLGAYTTMADLVRGNDEQVVEDFYWYLLHSTAAHAFPEGIYPATRTVWYDTIPHGTGASNYAVLLRHMLVHESGDELHLLIAVPDGWLAEGQQIRVERAPTHFGPLSLLVQGTKQGVKIDLTPPTRQPPKKIVVHLPRSRPPLEVPAGAEVVLRPDQKQRWNFATVVEKYQRTNPPPIIPEQPGSAMAVVEPKNVRLENAAICMSWQVAEGRLRPGPIVDRLSGRTIPGGGEVFSVALGDGRNISASDMKLLRPPQSEDLPVDAKAVRASSHYAGKCISATLAAKDGTLQVDWRAMLRDGDNYIRQELSLRAKDKDLPLAEIVLGDWSAEGAKTVGSVRGSPVTAGNLFFACENPLANNRGQAGHVRCALSWKTSLRAGKTFRCTSVVGVAPAGQMRRAFLCYVERERARPYQPFLHYNSWYDLSWIDRNLDEPQCLAAVNLFGRELVEKRGVRLDSFVFDDGWDDPHTLWQFHAGFPRGYVPLRDAAAQYHSAVGVWLSPFGGYSPKKEQRLKYGRPQGFETNSRGFAMAGPKYYARFRDACRQMIEKYGVNYFKFDGIANGLDYDKLTPADLADIAALLRLTEELREMRPDVYLNLTTGTWPSPYWLWHGDSVWRNGNDSDFCGQGSMRQQWINYRDVATQANVVRRAPLYPLNALMNQGIMYARLGTATRAGNDVKDLVDEFRMFFGDGTQLQELYMTPALMTPPLWDALAEAANWSRANADVLVDTHWIGGDAGKSEPYGYASWSPRKGILCVRNPSKRSRALTLKLAEAFELPPGAPRQYTLKSPWKADAAVPTCTIAAEAEQRIELRPFEVRVLEATPREPSN